MKKVNLNLLLMLVVLGLLLLAALALVFVSDNVLTQTSAKDVLSNAGEVGDVEGYARIAEGLGTGLVTFLSGIVYALAFLAMIPTGLAILFAVLGRIVFCNGRHLLAYRILMGIAYFFAIVIDVLLILFFASQPIMLICPAVLTAALVVCIRNTYTDRVLT